jgi:DNA uptake protein ComE-like DNA-binding protein
MVAFAAEAPKNPDPREDVTAWANEATVEQLKEVKGIGDKLAALIIAGRPFKDSAAVDAVKGIGPVLWARILEHCANLRD